MQPDVDLVVVFRAAPNVRLSKQQIREDAAKAEQQYQRLSDTLARAGLRAVARRGESLGQLLIFVYCPNDIVKSLAKRERQSDFLSGLPAAPVASEDDIPILAPSDRIRLIHSYISSMPSDGGLGIHPGSSDWDLVESIFCLHDEFFNSSWIHDWTHSKISSISDTVVRDQFGEAVALYFAFLKAYTKALIFPAVVGTAYFLFRTPYSISYSLLLVLWSTIFVEWWRVKERIVSLRFGSKGSFRVERRRAEYDPGFTWWKRELRVVASLPIILAFVGVLAVILTSIFVFEAFVTRLYTGPGQQLLGFSPTILFTLFVPRLLAIYQSVAKRLTRWENHAHHSSHISSLTLKTFALNSVVAYLGLALSAFVYVPFGEGIMHLVQSVFSNNVTTTSEKGVWDANSTDLHRKLDPSRLKNQMFAYTVTQQIINTFLEIGLPFIMRAVDKHRKKNGNSKRKVAFEDEKDNGGEEEKKLLASARHQASLPEYELFLDYSEMAIQFGYITIWSTIWPIASVMALVNNVFELRSDAFKIITHQRRPIPVRTDTIGPWLDALTFITWLGAVINTSLVYLFCPRWQDTCGTPSSIDKVHARLIAVAGAGGPALDTDDSYGDTLELLKTAVLIAFAASHGFILVRTAIRHVMERAIYKENKLVVESEQKEREVKAGVLKSMMENAASSRSSGEHEATGQKADAFYSHDEGLEEIRRISKEA